MRLQPQPTSPQRRDPHATRLLAIFLAALLGIAATSDAQISPGKLARAHQDLEGSNRCLDCHRSGTGVAADLCLQCHEPLQRRIAANRGLHASPGYEQCERCHIEHHGEEFELIWWGDQGINAFDHALTGYLPEGKHSQLDCRSCHRSESIQQPSELTGFGKNLNRTFLGLDPGCQSCHRDPHQAEFSPKACTDCHNQTAWRPAQGFDHSKTDFALSGSHREVSCADCHRDFESPDALVFRQQTACASCHGDPHEGDLGASCSACHQTDRWVIIKPGSFNHQRTAFPLKGLHSKVACDGCHGSGSRFAVAEFARCGSCHSDPHLGQFADRQDGGSCDSCHDESGFVPSHFGLEEHENTTYPLVGAHLAVGCNECHGTISSQNLTAATADQTPDSADLSLNVMQFDFANRDCTTCHDSPHAGSGVAALHRLSPISADCTGCHSIDGWRPATFDHDATGFALDGGHDGLGCLDCHPASDPEATAMRFDTAVPSCSTCHTDPHHGQFDRNSSPASCTECHSSIRWQDLSFDHDLNTGYPLEGAHREAACESCHRTETRTAGSEVVTFVRYRPLASDCSDCHR